MKQRFKVGDVVVCSEYGTPNQSNYAYERGIILEVDISKDHMYKIRPIESKHNMNEEFHWFDGRGFKKFGKKVKKKDLKKFKKGQLLYFKGTGDDAQGMGLGERFGEGVLLKPLVFDGYLKNAALKVSTYDADGIPLYINHKNLVYEPI